jgi:hypothetical protein
VGYSSQGFGLYSGYGGGAVLHVPSGDTRQGTS